MIQRQRPVGLNVWGRGLALLPLALLSACIGQPRAAETRSSALAHPTIVSLNPCSDAILADVADPRQLLAISHYSQDPRSTSMDLVTARRFRTTRGTIEEVLALQPDRVVTGSFLGPAEASAYRRLGLNLIALPIASTIDQARDQIRQLAALAGHPDRGETLIARIDAALANAAPPIGSPPIPTVVWQSGGMVPGDGTLIADLLRRTGFANFTAARGLHQADLLPLERMLADPPRLILTAGGSSETGQGHQDRILSHPALAALNTTTRASLDPVLLYCGGPTIIRAAHRLTEIRRTVTQQKLPLVPHLSNAARQPGLRPAA